MKSSEILFEAARIMADDPLGGCCYSITRALGKCIFSEPTECYIASRCAREYFSLLEPVKNNMLYWLGIIETATILDGNKYVVPYGSLFEEMKFNTHRRVIALCLAAAIAESEGN